MSKRQRRRVAKRRNMHVEHVKRRSVLDPRLPIALAAVAVPAVAAPAAQASTGAHHMDAAALRGGAEPGRGAEPRMQPAHHIESGRERSFQVILPVIGQLAAGRSHSDHDRTRPLGCRLSR